MLTKAAAETIKGFAEGLFETKSLKGFVQAELIQPKLTIVTDQPRDHELVIEIKPNDRISPLDLAKVLAQKFSHPGMPPTAWIHAFKFTRLNMFEVFSGVFIAWGDWDS